MHITAYGIRNCDTMKKAHAWLSAAGLPHEFHDYRKDGITADTLQRWCAHSGWESLLNRRGTTWRRLTAEEQQVADEAAAIVLMVAHPSLIRRPVVEYGEDKLLIGFDAARFADALQQGTRP